jgi:hypothetical protein
MFAAVVVNERRTSGHITQLFLFVTCNQEIAKLMNRQDVLDILRTFQHLLMKNAWQNEHMTPLRNKLDHCRALVDCTKHISIIIHAQK